MLDDFAACADKDINFALLWWVVGRLCSTAHIVFFFSCWFFFVSAHKGPQGLRLSRLFFAGTLGGRRLVDHSGESSVFCCSFVF